MSRHFDELLDKSIDIWFAEDIGDGDHTTLSTIPEKATGEAVLLVEGQRDYCRHRHRVKNL